jgi:hypothetical protein
MVVATRSAATAMRAEATHAHIHIHPQILLFPDIFPLFADINVDLLRGFPHQLPA